MRRKISGMVAAVAVMMTAGSASAMACGGGLFTSCAPCGYAAPCAPAPVYVAPVVAYSGCYTGCGWTAERLADPVRQYYYVNQGPTYTGPGNWAPVRTYEEGSVSYARPYYGYRAHRHYGYRYGVRPAYRYGYGARLGYHAPRHSMRYGAYHHGAARYSVGPRMDGQHMMRHRY
ncbi:hypothetical protein KMZ29_11660 [Bradyrhizobium sediminis]|uniref:Uncharacterized protein n=1 Tax=Bradyrhizobium sediminis TaxID=2840469 RepID=A0A975NI50_9BRAD|nr:hypothetical protein [Bradyrhizobium sediminis]QWG15250.1 hypothetical protein KMZ29_11660 [Bradyrhizobium sediminis]